MNAVAIENGIFVTWDAPDGIAVNLYRAKQGESWEYLGEIANSSYRDTMAEPDTFYHYRIIYGDNAEISPVVWYVEQESPNWCLKYVLVGAFVPFSCPGIFAQICDRTGQSIFAYNVIKLTLSVYEVIENDVTYTPIYNEILKDKKIDPETVILPNFVCPDFWPDSLGYNFKAHPMDNMKSGQYEVRYTATLTNGEIVMLPFKFTIDKNGRSGHVEKGFKEE